MVAYGFKAQFEGPICTGAKRQTLRNPRKRHALTGEAIQLYYGMRTRQCRLIGTAVALDVSPIRLDLDAGRVEYATGNAITTLPDLDAFAVVDGFIDWRHLMAFWAKEHPGLPQWEGVRVLWGDTFQPAAVVS